MTKQATLRLQIEGALEIHFAAIVVGSDDAHFGTYRDGMEIYGRAMASTDWQPDATCLADPGLAA